MKPNSLKHLVGSGGDGIFPYCSSHWNEAVRILSEAGWIWTTEPAWNADTDDVDPGEGLRMPNGQLMPETTILGPGPAYDPQRRKIL